MTLTTERRALAIAWGDAPETEEIRIVCKTTETIILQVDGKGFLLAETSGGGHFSIPSIPEIEANIRKHDNNLRLMSLKLLDSDRGAWLVFCSTFNEKHLDEAPKFVFVPRTKAWQAFEIDELADWESKPFWILGDPETGEKQC